MLHAPEDSETFFSHRADKLPIKKNSFNMKFLWLFKYSICNGWRQEASPSPVYNLSTVSCESTAQIKKTLTFWNRAILTPILCFAPCHSHLINTAFISIKNPPSFSILLQYLLSECWLSAFSAIKTTPTNFF